MSGRHGPHVLRGWNVCNSTILICSTAGPPWDRRGRPGCGGAAPAAAAGPTHPAATAAAPAPAPAAATVFFGATFIMLVFRFVFEQRLELSCLHGLTQSTGGKCHAPQPCRTERLAGARWQPAMSAITSCSAHLPTGADGLLHARQHRRRDERVVCVVAGGRVMENGVSGARVLQQRPPAGKLIRPGGRLLQRLPRRHGRPQPWQHLLSRRLASSSVAACPLSACAPRRHDAAANKPRATLASQPVRSTAQLHTAKIG